MTPHPSWPLPPTPSWKAGPAARPFHQEGRTMSNHNPPIGHLVAVAEQFQVEAIGIYRCEACAETRARWGTAEVSRHARRKGELLAALDQAAGDALRAAHRAGVSLDAAEQRIGGLVR